MSNIENFSADELLKRLKENMGEDTGEKKEPEKIEEELTSTVADDVVETAETAENAELEKAKEAPEAALPKVHVKKKYKIASRAARDISDFAPEKESAEEEKKEEPAPVSDETIAFDIPSAEESVDPTPFDATEVFAPVSEDTDEEFDAPTTEIPGITELEAPDADAFEAAAEDSSPEKLLSGGERAFGTFEEAAELDATDLSLIAALGDQETLDKAREQLGEDKFLEYTNTISIAEEELAAEEEQDEKAEQYSGLAFSGEEYESHEQTPGIMEKYKNEKSRIKLRLLGSAILAVCLFIFENLHIWGVSLPGAFNAIEYPAVHAFICLQLLVLVAALSYKELYAGVMSAISFNFTENTVAAAAVAVTAICDLLFGFFGYGAEPGLYNFAAAFILILLALHDYFGVKREMFSFGVVSSKKPKYVVLTETKNEIVEHGFEYDQIFEEPDLELNVKRVGFVNNYFARTNAKTDSGKLTPYFVFGAIAVSIILAVISAVNTKSAATAFEVANLTALMCLPVSLFASSSLPFFLASKRALENDSAIIGEASVNEYSGASTVVFDDKDVFPARSVKVKSIKVYGEARIDTVLYDLTSVYAKLGGPLYEVLSKATAEIGASDNVELTECADSGACATVDSERKVLVGDSTYMEQNDIFPVYDYEDEIQLAGGNIRIMYIAYDGELASKMYVQYAIDPDFDGMLRRLNKNGMKVTIKTMDPNIDNTLLVGKAKPVNYPAKIEKCSIEAAGSQNVSSADSGIVSRGNIRSLVSAILLCDRLQHVKLTTNIVKIMSVAVGLAIMLIFIISNSSMLILPLFVALYHLFWVLPVFAISRMYLK